jgi:hypothetical protein
MFTVQTTHTSVSDYLQQAEQFLTAMLMASGKNFLLSQ